jgi:hypothetical protein
MLDRSLFQIDVEGNQATIAYSHPGCRATVIWMSDRLPQIEGYVSHQVIELPGRPRLEFVLSGAEINSIVDQAFVTLSSFGD